MKKRKAKRRKSDREVLKEIFPPEIVREIDATLEELNPKRESRENPTGKILKPWGRKWVEKRKP
jgi:hypothetical protein